MGLARPPLFRALDEAGRVLVIGAGGGFDVYAGLPLAFALRDEGKEVTLANVTFSDLTELRSDDWLAAGLARIDAGAPGRREYFPERTLSWWLEGRGVDWEVFAVQRGGVQPVRAAFEALVEHTGADAVVLVDGGTDALMHGDEAGLGTPAEDATSILALHGLPLATKLLVCLGFGIDAYHGVAHVDVLENLAGLDRAGAYLGALSIPSRSPEALAYLSAVQHAERHTPQQPSIVQGQIAAALQGAFGNIPLAARTDGSELFINPLMAIYFAVELDALAQRLRYAKDLENTKSVRQVELVIDSYRGLNSARPHRHLPQ